MENVTATVNAATGGLSDQATNSPLPREAKRNIRKRRTLNS